MNPISLPGKIADYSGPKTSKDIALKIEKECKSLGIDLSYSDISKIISNFFHGIIARMKHGDYIIIDQLGEFGMTPIERTRRLKRDESAFLDKDQRRRLCNRRKVYNYYLKRKWRKFNEVRKEKELSEWKFKDWLKVRGYKLR